MCFTYVWFFHDGDMINDTVIDVHGNWISWNYIELVTFDIR